MDRLQLPGNRVNAILLIASFVFLVSPIARAQGQLPPLIVDEDAPVVVAKSDVTPTPVQVSFVDKTTAASGASEDKSFSSPVSPKSADESPKQIEDAPKQAAESALSTEEPAKSSGGSLGVPSSISTTIGTVSTTKDINVLLASKVDAENDLTAPMNEPSSIEDGLPESKRPLIELDTPVDTIRTSGDERFHYSVGSSIDKDPAPAEKDFGEKDQSDVDKNRDKRITTTVPATEEPASSTQTASSLQPSSTAAPAAAPTDAPVVDTTSTTVSQPAAAQPPVVASTEAPSNSPPELEAKKETKNPQEISSSTSEPSKKELSSSTSVAPSSEVTTAKSDPSSSTKPPMVQNSSTAPTQVKSEGGVGKQPASVPSILAVALGTALGAAVNPILNKAAQPTKSPVGSTTVSSSQNKTSSSFTDKWDKWTPSTGSPTQSSTSPTGTSTSTASSVGVPHQRRRPIIPSIRRRLRPHNRFNPFPWSVETYGNDPGDLEGVDFGSSTKAPASSSTNRPSRRRTTSSTTSSPVSSTSRTSEEPSSGNKPSVGSEKPASNSPKESDSGVESEADQDPIFTRRRLPSSGESGSRYRPGGYRPHRDRPSYHRDRPENRDTQYQHRRRHHHNGQDHNLSGRRRHQQPGSWVPGHRHSEYEPELDDSQPFESPIRPFSSGSGSSGFSLFNSPELGVGGMPSSSSPGSAFDLLNPFTSWLDDITKPRPPRVQPSSGPIPVEGSYNDGPVGHRGDHRDNDYHHEHDHHHDCHHDHDHDHHGHDHDHNHDHHGHDHHREPPHRPSISGGIGGGRPYGDRDRDREPYRPPHGGYDTYRPNRPRNSGSDTSSSPAISITPSSSSSGRPFRPSHSSSGSSSSSSSEIPVGPRMYAARRVPSILSPFDSLFGSLHDDLFGGLRSSAYPDTVIRSPKISNEQPAPKSESASSESARVVKID